MSLRPVWAIIVVRPSLKHKNQAESWAQVVGLLTAHASNALALGYCARVSSVDRFCSFLSHKAVSSLPNSFASDFQNFCE